MHPASVGTRSSYMVDTPEARLSARKVGQSSKAVLLVTSGCLCYNCAYLFALSSDWGFEKIGLYHTQGEQAVNTVYNIVFFTNAASDVVLIFSIYFKEYTNADSEGRNIIGILKMFIAWNAVTIFLCWIAACIQVYYRYSKVHEDVDGSANVTVETSGTSAFAVNDAEKPHLHARYFWSVLVFITTMAVVRALVLVCFYVSYLSELEEQADATPPLSPEQSSNSVMDPRNPWRWFQFKRHACSRPRSRHVPSDGRQSRRSGADTRSLVGWFTPISRRSAATPIERSTGPGRHRAAGRPKSRSRAGGVTGGASSVASGVMQPANLYDPAELRVLTDHEDPHVQSGYALHVVPNRERVSYIWHQTSRNSLRPEDGSPRPQRLSSSSSFEAMQIEQFGACLGRPQLRHFEDTARYDPGIAVTLEEPPVADAGRHTDIPVAEGRQKQLAGKASRTETATKEPTQVAPSHSPRRLSLPSDGFDRSNSPEQVPPGHLSLKAKMMSLLTGWHDGVQEGSASSRAAPSGHCEAAPVPERQSGPERRQVSFDVAPTGDDSPLHSTGTNQHASEAELQGLSLTAQDARTPKCAADSAEGRGPDDVEEPAASTGAAVRHVETSALVAERCTTAVSDSQTRTGRHVTLSVASPQTPTMLMLWRSGAFICSPTRTATRDSEQQTDQ